eukprot:gene1103-biopygen337
MNIETESDFSDSESISDISSLSELSAEEYDELMAYDDSEVYDPHGIESDDDQPGCCHWSTESEADFEGSIAPSERIPEYGRPAVIFDAGTKPHEIVEGVMDDEFIMTCIGSTNEHGAEDPSFVEKIGEISRDEAEIRFVRGFFAIKWHLRLLGYRQYRWAWSEDPLQSQPEIKKTMSREVFRLMLKHFRVVKASSLPPKDHPDYNPLQNINSGVEYLRQKSLSKWTVGWKMCVDEGRVTSKSKRNPYKIRNPDKPIRMGWTICKVSDKGANGGNYVANHVVKVGKKTYKTSGNGKNYDIVEQLISEFKDSGRLVVMDSGFPTIKLMEDAKNKWHTRLIATQRGNTAHFPCSHKDNLRSARQFVRGFSKSLHKGFLNITYWNDNNVVVFLDNDIKSGQQYWEPVEVNQGREKVIIHMPRVAALYREMYGWVDRTKQQLSYYNAEFRSVRKQNRIFDSLCEMYVLGNGHTLWRNSTNLHEQLSKNALSQSSFRFEVIRIWYAKFKMYHGRMPVLHYPSDKPRGKKRSLESALASPRKGRHEEKRISAEESSSKEKRLKCRICHKKTSFCCKKCSGPGDPFALCSNTRGRDCWNKFHAAREFDLPSSQSQENEEEI